MATKVSINNAFVNSGINSIPDLEKIEAYKIETEFFGNLDIDNDWDYEPKRLSPRDIYSIVVNLKNVKSEDKWNFVVKNFQNKDTNIRDAAYEIATRYFGIHNDQPFITARDETKIKDIINLIENDNKEKDYAYLAKIAYGADKRISEFEKEVSKSLCEKYNLESENKVIPYYLTFLSSDKINICTADILNKNNQKVPVYLITTDDNIGVIYNPINNSFDYAGKVNNNSIVLEEKYMSLNFENIPKKTIL